MHTLAATDWLSVWDAASNESAVSRSSRLAAAGWPEDDVDADTPGRRNSRLLALRGSIFGRQIACIAMCSGCGAMLDLSLDVAELMALHDSATAEVRWHHDGAEYRFRLPTAHDVADLVDEDPAVALETLVRRCLLAGEFTACNQPELTAALSAQYEDADPLGHVVIDLSCPECRTHSRPVLDIAALLWTEVRVLCEQLLGQVHVLAGAYGWSEADILNLPSDRRRRYIAMVQA